MDLEQTLNIVYIAIYARNDIGGQTASAEMRHKTLLLVCFLILAGCARETNPPLISFADGRDWVLVSRPLIHQIENTPYTISIPIGFVSDFASSPRVTWSIIPQTGRYQFAAVIHDYLYWEQACTKPEADKILFLIMEDEKVSWPERNMIYGAVVLAGADAWEKNKKMRQQGLPRIIPKEFLDIPPNVDWKEYQQQIFKKGVRSSGRPPSIERPAYCHAAQIRAVASN